MAPSISSEIGWPHAEGGMAERVRTFDWAATPLGAMESWAPELRGVIDLMLASPLVSSVALLGDRLLIYNDAAAGLYGSRHPGALGRPLGETFSDSYPSVAPFYDRAFDGEAVAVMAQPLALAQAGDAAVFDAYLTPVRAANGAVLGVHMVGLEVGDRARADAALRESEGRYRALVTAGSYMIYRLSPDWRVMHQLSGADLLADTVTPMEAWADTYLFAHDRPAIEQAIDQAVRTGTPFDLEHRVRTADGRASWIHSRAVPILGEGGEVVEWFGVAVPIDARKRAEAALSDSERRYRILFETMGQGYALVELVRDASGRAVDQRYIEFNPAIERLLGVSASRAVGKLASEVFPGMQAWWTETFSQVVRDQTPQRVEHFFTPLDRWFEVYAYPAGGDRFITLYEDVSERKRAELALRESEERQTFLLGLSDALRPLVDPGQIEATVSRLVGEALRVDRAAYGEMEADDAHMTVARDWSRPGVSSTVGRFPIDEFGAFFTGPLRAGRAATVEDAATDPRIPADVYERTWKLIDCRAAIAYPLVKQGRLVAAFFVHSARARTWSARDVALVEEAVERTWGAVERGRAEAALRSGEERFQQFGEASQDVLWIRDAETFQWEYLTPAFETIYGLDRDAALRGDNMAGWLDLILPEDRERAAASLERVRHGEGVTFEYRVRRPSDGAISWLRNTDFPIRDAAGRVVRIGGIGHDITALKKAEEALASADARQRALLVGIPQLVWRASKPGHWTWASPQWTEFTGQGERESHGWGWLDPVHPEDRQSARDAWAAAIERGAFDVDYRILDARSGDYRWFQTRAAPVRDRRGRIVEWLGTSTDIDDQRRLQQRQGVLVSELQHRTFNLIGLVRSMADATLRSSETLEEFKTKFRDRVDALARVQRMLSRLKKDDRISFDELIRGELTAAGVLDDDDGKVILAGPDGVALRSSTVQTFAMALHELTTNALKYGALHQSDGRLEVRWRLENGGDDAPWLHVDWRETGVAIPSGDGEPIGTGQGRLLIEEALPYQLQARTTYALEADGVRCTIALPVSQQVGGPTVGAHA